MAQDVKVNIVALNRFMSRVVQPYLLKKAEDIAEEARRLAPVGATNDLRDSIEVRPIGNGGVQIRVNAPHAGFVEYGTGPQANPPRAPYYPKLRRRGLILWSESKGLNPGAVASSIAVKGTPANPFFEESITRVLGRFNFRWIRRDLGL